VSNYACLRRRHVLTFQEKKLGKSKATLDGLVDDVFSRNSYVTSHIKVLELLKDICATKNKKINNKKEGKPIYLTPKILPLASTQPRIAGLIMPATHASGQPPRPTHHLLREWNVPSVPKKRYGRPQYRNLRIPTPPRHALPQIAPAHICCLGMGQRTHTNHKSENRNFILRLVDEGEAVRETNI